MAPKSPLVHPQEAENGVNPFLEVTGTKPPAPGKAGAARKGPSNHPSFYPKGNLPCPNIPVHQQAPGRCSKEGDHWDRHLGRASHRTRLHPPGKGDFEAALTRGFTRKAAEIPAWKMKHFLMNSDSCCLELKLRSVRESRGRSQSCHGFLHHLA